MTGGGTTGGSSSGNSSTSSGAADDETDGQQVDTASQTAPGLYGDAVQIRIDMLRAVDTSAWFAANGAETPIVDTDITPKPSGSLQTVAYFLNGTTNLSGGGGSVAPMTDPYSTPDSLLDMNTFGGLVRQVVDHPIASWALGNGGGGDLDRYSQLFAPEVVSLTFRYFDGTQWGTSWDSYEQGGLPVAVEVTLVLATTVGNMPTSSLYQGFQDPDSVYTMVIQLPAGLPTDETEAQL
jgi:hypothetical protein